MSQENREWPCDEPVIAQVELVGEPFVRRVGREAGRFKKGFQRSRRVRVVGALDTQTGMTQFHPASKTPTVVSELPHSPLSNTEKLADLAESTVSPTTARKKGASTPGVDTEKEYEKRGGRGIRIPKPAHSFASASEAGRIESLRQQSGNRVTR